MSNPLSLENRLGKKFWRAPKQKKIWTGKVWGVSPLHPLNGSDQWFHSCISYFSMLKTKEFPYGGQDRSCNEKSEFFSSDRWNNKSLSFIFCQNCPKAKDTFGIWRPWAMRRFSVVTQTAQWNSYYFSLLNSFYHKVPFLPCLCYSHLFCSRRRKWECRI